MKLPATLLTSAVCTLIYVFFSLRVIVARWQGEKLAVEAPADAKLHLRIRIHGNFAEYVPLALLMMAVLEASGANTSYLYSVGAVLIAARVAHAVGLPQKAPNPLRAFGITVTLGVLVAESITAVTLWL